MWTFPSTTDGVVTIRPFRPSDAAVLVAGRDEEFRRFLGEGSDEPCPAAVIEAGDRSVAGWVDWDQDDRHWLAPGEANLGYNILPGKRGQGLATRAVALLLHRLSLSTDAHPVRTATLLIHPDNVSSLAVAERLGFVEAGPVDGDRFFRRPLPPLSYSDGVVTIRRFEPEADLDADLEAKDDEQIDWLWLPGQRQSWEAMTPDEQRDHALRGLRSNRESFGTGPKWTFAADAGHDRYVAYVDCVLANDGVPPGAANLSYSAHPAHRGRGHVSRAVRLALQFLAEHTGVREAHIGVDERNEASRRVARAVGAVEVERFTDAHGHRMIRHVIAVPRP